jgi:hypothetical protein
VAPTPRLESLSMKLLPAILPLLCLSACATEVYHPTKTEAEMRVDIKACTDWANRKYWMDPVAALLNAYDCLEEKGYKKGHSGLETEVQKAVNEDRRQNDKPLLPCRVPCKPERR